MSRELLKQALDILIKPYSNKTESDKANIIIAKIEAELAKPESDILCSSCKAIGSAYAIGKESGSELKNEVAYAAGKRFPWGKVIDRFTFDFDGEVFDVTKYNPWISRGSSYVIRTPSDEIEYHCEELHQSAGSLMALLIHWIAFKRMGSNNGSLAEGVCRALCVELENK